MVVIAEWHASPCGLKLREVPSNGNDLKGFKKEILHEKVIRLDEHGGGNRIYSALRLIALRISASATLATRMACVSSLRSTALTPRSF